MRRRNRIALTGAVVMASGSTIIAAGSLFGATALPPITAPATTTSSAVPVTIVQTQYVDDPVYVPAGVDVPPIPDGCANPRLGFDGGWICG